MRLYKIHCNDVVYEMALSLEAAEELTKDGISCVFIKDVPDTMVNKKREVSS